MLLDCDSILYYQKFDADDTANVEGKNVNDWWISDVKESLNGTEENDGFLQTAFTTTEKNAIAKSTKASHALTTYSETGVNVASWTQEYFVNYVALNGEQIFLLDAEDVSNGAYGYSMTDSSCGNRKKTGSSAAYWWLRSASSVYDSIAGYSGSIYQLLYSRGCTVCHRTGSACKGNLRGNNQAKSGGYGSGVDICQCGECSL